MRIVPVNPMRTDIYADGATAISLPNQSFGASFEYRVLDNTGTFSGANCTVSSAAGIDGGASVTLSTAFQSRSFVWIGGTTGWL